MCSATALLLPYPVALAWESSSVVCGISVGSEVPSAAAIEEQKINCAGSGLDVVVKESLNRLCNPTRSGRKL
jgi:hypothetical protein